MVRAGPTPNRLRGEIVAIFDGEPRLMCLTLGALAELEGAYRAEGLTALCHRLAAGTFSAGDLIRILAAGLRGGGNVANDEDVAQMTVEGGVPAMARIAAELLLATFGGEEGGEAELRPDPLRPQPA